MIIGPSHVVRWKRLKSFFDMGVDFYGFGGLPIWHEKVLSLSQSRDPFILVGDFRFGNAFHLTGEVRDTFAVKKELISPAVDRLMYETSINSLDTLSRSDVRLVFWCLFIREYKNIQEKKYFNEGVYRHPIWNISDLESRYANSVKLADLLDQNLDFLFTDSSNHPSIFGFYFLKLLHAGLTSKEAFLATLRVKHSFSNIYSDFGSEKVVVSGTNSTFRLIKIYLEKDIIGASSLRSIHVRDANEAMFSSHMHHRNLVFFAKEEDSKLDVEQFTFFDRAPYENKLLVIKKERKTYFYTSRKQEKPQLSFVMIHQDEEEEVIGDIYNLIGLSQVLYYALSIVSKEGHVEIDPYDVLKKLLAHIG